MFQLSTRQKVFIRSIQRIILRYEKEDFENDTEKHEPWWLHCSRN